MYAYLKQVHPPTGIELCEFCHFFNLRQKSLVVAARTQLQVFNLISIDDGSSSASYSAGSADGAGSSSLKASSASAVLQQNREGKRKLECAASFSLFGNVVSMKTVRAAGYPRDLLLLSFRDAKLSVVEYDPSTHDLKTVSLHCFEEEELKGGRTDFASDLPVVRVDPQDRCAAMLCFGTKLVVLPFRKDDLGADADSSIFEAASASGSGLSLPGLEPGHDDISSERIGSSVQSYVIDIRELDEQIVNVIDYQFLYGYYEPTLFILYEPLRTWGGRVAVRQDTCAIAAISLNITQKVHPIIWSISSLPFDCHGVLPVPKPIGGVLILAVNSLLYLNQSVPPFGVSLNSLTKGNTNFPLQNQGQNVKISLDCANAAFLAFDRLAVSLKTGEVYVITLLLDGMRAVKGFHFDRAAASVLTTCMTVCGNGFLFLGSRLGNSLLLKYVEKGDQSSTASADVSLGLGTSIQGQSRRNNTEEPPGKRKRLDLMGEWVAGDDPVDGDRKEKVDEDDLDFYPNIEEKEKTITTYNFEVSDSILNIGPCGNSTIGEPPFLSEEFESSDSPDLELVLTSGHGKNGALTILQRAVRPQVVTTFELPGCVDMWTLKAKSGEGEEDSHSFLILGREDGTMVLQTGQEIMELDQSGFATQGPTVFAGNIGCDKFIVQVSPMSVRLLEGVQQIQHIPFDVGSPIVAASIADPYLLVMTEEGVVVALTFHDESPAAADDEDSDEDDSGPHLTVRRAPLMQHPPSKVVALCAFVDSSGLFTTESPTVDPFPEHSTLSAVGADLAAALSLDKSEAKADDIDGDEDEEALLYGTSSSSSSKPSTSGSRPPLDSNFRNPLSPEPATHSRPARRSAWAAIGRENGALEFYSMPDFKLCYAVKNFSLRPRVLADQHGSAPVPDHTNQKAAYQQQMLQKETPLISELALTGLGAGGRKPYLLARVEDELVVYECFPFHQHSMASGGRLKIRFRKVLLDSNLRDRKKSRGLRPVDPETRTWTRMLRPFSNVSGYEGVFIAGTFPFWFFITIRGIPRLHPMNVDGGVTCFAPFDNVNCPTGFLYFNREGDLRVCILPTHLSYDNPWPIRKIPLRCTPHFIVYHPVAKIYAVGLSTEEPVTEYVRQTGEDREFEPQQKDVRYVWPTVDKFSISFFSPLNWDPIPNAKLELDNWENATCMRHVSLKDTGTVSGLKGFIVVGTTNCYGEECTSRGRILILDLIEVVPEPGQPLTRTKVKTVYDKEQKGPVTALAQLNGYLVTNIGQRIILWELKSDDLIGIAFIDTQIYIHTLVTVKNFILYGDVTKSVALIRYSSEHKNLSLVARDVKPLEVYSAEFLVDNASLAFLVSDSLQNLVVFMYQPEAKESAGGQRLVRRADFNLGSHVTTLWRIRCRTTDALSTERKISTQFDRRHVTMFATLDGGLGHLLPVGEKVYRRLLMLQNILNQHSPHLAGLNPKAFRTVAQGARALQNPNRNILDGELLSTFLFMSSTERQELCRKIGATVDAVVDDIVEMERVASHF